MTSVSVKLTENTVAKGLPKFRKGAVKMTTKQIHLIALLIQGTAKKSLVSGPKTGRLYKRRSIIHRASAPGQTPASDTGNLLSHIKVDLKNGSADVGATVKHGASLEFKSPKKGGRPWLKPALDKHIRNIEKNISKGFNRL